MGESSRKCGKEAFHHDAIVVGITNSSVVGMELKQKRLDIKSRDSARITYLNIPRGWDTVGEISGIEIALQRSDRENQSSALNLLLDFRVSERAHIDLPTS